MNVKELEDGFDIFIDWFKRIPPDKVIEELESIGVMFENYNKEKIKCEDVSYDYREC